MAFSRFIAAGLAKGPIEVYGDGSQTRDFTFVSDAVEANMSAFAYEGSRRVFNIGGGSRISIRDILSKLERRLGGRLDVRHLDRAKGDVPDTWADTGRARAELDFNPLVTIDEGLDREIEWYRQWQEQEQRGV
jgi:nucleoside-diphosphate-sugar epimerase